MNTQKDEYKTSRILYIIEAALEYFISILITGAYLAKITSSLGISDSLTGILTSFVSLGCGFQLFSIFFVRQSKVKRKIVIFHSINQLFFALIYLVPFINLSKEIKIGLFIVFLLFGHIINNVINSPKINWYMSLVDNNKRGRFTANKEMVSLMGGMIFTFIMGSVIDYFEDMNNITGSFIVLGISVFILMILHSLTLIFSKEQEVENNEKASTKEINKIYEELKKILKKYDGDGFFKNCFDFIRQLFQNTRIKCKLIFKDILEEMTKPGFSKKEELRRDLLDLSNIHRDLLENIISLLGAL